MVQEVLEPRIGTQEANVGRRPIYGLTGRL
jgi:hypothetical protein